MSAEDEEFTGYAAGTEEPTLRGIPLPDNARFAVRIQLVLEHWDSQATLTAPDGRRVSDYRTISAQLYGVRTGFRRLLDVMDECGTVATVSTTGNCGVHWPELVDEMVRRGHEVVGHAYSQDEEVALMGEDDDYRTVMKTVAALEKASGYRPVGWASGAARRGPFTAKSLLRAGVFHTNDFREADVPFVAARLGRRRLVAMPRTDEINDNYALYNAGHTPANYVDYFKRTFDRLYVESDEHPGRVLTAVAHSTLLGRPWGAAALAECCAYTKQHADVWQTTSRAIAEHYLEKL